MTSGALPGLGTLLKIGDGAGTEAFTTIAEIKKIGGPKLKTDSKDVTNMTSTGGYEEVIPTIKRTGEVTLGISFIPTHATHSQTSGLLRDWKNKTLRNFQLVWPDVGNTTWTLPAYVTGFEPDASVEGSLDASVTLKISGQPTLAG